MTANMRKQLCENGAVPALLKCLKYSLGPVEDIPGLEREKQAKIEEMGAEKWMAMRGPTVNIEKQMNHEVFPRFCLASLLCHRTQ